MPTPTYSPTHPPRVSVIVRSMGRPSLAQAVNSVASQTYPDIELVIVNALGPAHGALPGICGEFAVVTAAAVTGGPLRRAQAANCGLDQANGSLALFLDDDDLLLPGHVQKLVEALLREPGAPAAFTDVEMGRSSEGQWLALHRFDAAFDATRLLFENYLPIHGVMFRRTGSAAGPRFDEAFDLFEDWDFWLQLAAFGAFLHAPGVSARYCVTDIAQSNVFSDSPATRAARARLFDKWQHRVSPTQHRELLSRLQQLYREAPQLRAAAALAQVTSSNMQAILKAREHELVEAARMQAGLQHVLAERERELADAEVQQGALRAILAEREAGASAAHAEALLKRLGARELELEHALAHTTGLEAIVLARERELTEALAHAGRLSAILAARDGDIGLLNARVHALSILGAEQEQDISRRQTHAGELTAQLTEREQALVSAHALADSQATAIARSEGELRRLHAETPVQALKRTLRKKPHDPRNG